MQEQWPVCVGAALVAALPVPRAPTRRPYASGDPIMTSNKSPARGSGRAQLASFNFPDSLIWHLRQEPARWRLPG